MSHSDQTARGEADHYWQAGDRARAIRILHNTGWQPGDVLDYVRSKGLDEDAARAEIRDSGIDWT